MFGVGMMMVLIGASGVDAPDPTANYVMAIIGLVIVIAAEVHRKGSSHE